MAGENGLRDTEVIVRDGVGGTKMSVCVCSKLYAAILGNILFREVYEEVGSGECGCSGWSSKPHLCGMLG